MRDSVLVINTAQGDGIQSNNDEDVAKGWVSIDGGTLEITAVNDGIQAETIVQVTGGAVNLNTGGGSGSASGQNSDGLSIAGNYTAGTKVVSVTLDGAATSISDTGKQITSMGGPAGRGGTDGGPGNTSFTDRG